jgi:2-iminobutanoate/2-iminopropanoate deaminase
MSKIALTAPLAPPAVGPYSHAVIANGMVFTSGQTGMVPGTKTLVEGVEAQTAQTLENVRAVLEASGSGLEHVVKTTVFLQDMNDFAKMNAIYARYFWRSQPARSTVQVAGLPLGALVEIETIALLR